MSISSTLVTDDWRFLDMGDAGQTTASMIKRGLSGTATFTPVGLTGVSVDDEPDWYIVARPRTGNYTLGRLVGQDGAQGVRLVSEVNGHAVVYRVERALRWNGQLVPGVDPVHVVLSGETIHLPDTTLVDGGGADFGQALVTVEEFIERARTAAVRAEAAADAVGEVDVSARQARDAAVSARDEVVGLVGAGAAEAVHADRVAADASAQSAAGSATVAGNHAQVAGSVAAQAAQAAVAEVVDGAPDALDTLRELAEKATDNSDQIATLLTMVGSKAEKSSFQTVTAAPASPTPGVFYFVVEA